MTPHIETFSADITAARGFLAGGGTCGLKPSGRKDVGGVLSVGGLGEDSFRHGTVASAVVELEVVTGMGEIVTCSRELHADLFAACLGGFGQFGIITRVKMGLIAVPARQRLCRLLYTDPMAYAADFSRQIRTNAPGFQ